MRLLDLSVPHCSRWSSTVKSPKAVHGSTIASPTVVATPDRRGYVTRLPTSTPPIAAPTTNTPKPLAKTTTAIRHGLRMPSAVRNLHTALAAARLAHEADLPVRIT